MDNEDFKTKLFSLIWKTYMEIVIYKQQGLVCKDEFFQLYFVDLVKPHKGNFWS